MQVCADGLAESHETLFLVSDEAAVNLRLVGDEEESFEGRLEVKRDGVWGTVCDDGFNDAAARVACVELGFGYVVRVT